MSFSSNTSNIHYDYQTSPSQLGTDSVAVSDFLTRVNLGPAQLREIAGLGAVDYLKLDEQAVTPGALPSRGTLDDLCYGTGTTYLAGLTFGGAWGLMEGLRGHSPNLKLRLNTILNSVTRRGPFIGNSCGILAIGYNSINGIIGNIKGKHDSINSVASGALVGLLFKSTAGLRAAGAASAICAATAGTWTLAKKHFFKY